MAVSIVTREDLLRPGVTPTDVLRTLPGVQVIESGGFGAPSSASVRGATSQQTPVYLAGIRINDDVGGGADLSTLPLWLTERVEVYRGHAPIEADRLGIGGAIFVDPRTPKRSEFGVGRTMGSFGTQSVMAHGTHRGETVCATIGAALSGARNDYAYLDDRGTLFDPTDDRTVRRENSDIETLDLWGLARARFGSGSRVDVVTNRFSRVQGVPRLALLPSRAARAESERILLGVSGRLPLTENADLVLRSGFIATEASYLDPKRELSLFAERTDISASRLEQTAALALRPSEKLLVRPSLIAAVERIVRTEDGVESARGQRLFTRPSLGLEWRPLEALVTRAVAAYECHGVGGGPCDIGVESGRLSAAYGFAALSVMGSVGRYVRVPTLGELSGVSEVVRGNPSLQRESAWSAEVGVRAAPPPTAEIDRTSVELTGFGRAADNLVAYQRTAQGYIVPYNIGQARLLGAEASATSRLWRTAVLGGSVSWLDPRDTTPGRSLANDLVPLRARIVAAARLRFEGPLTRGLDGNPAWSIEVSHVHQASRYADPAGLIVLPRQSITDLEFALRSTRDEVVARLRLANVFDRPRQDLIAYPLPGRAIYLTISISPPSSEPNN